MYNEERHLFKPLHGILRQVVFFRILEQILGQLREDGLERRAIGSRHCYIRPKPTKDVREKTEEAQWRELRVVVEAAGSRFDMHISGD